MDDTITRKIIHIDMDAFYASIEVRDDPHLKGLPIAVGGSSGRGVVMTASYEARKFGVRSAMPSVTAKRLCPDLIFVKSNMDKYREASNQIREIFYSYTDLVEPLSLDEAYLDVTDNKAGEVYASVIAEQIRQRIYEVTGLTASAGISYNKFLAKIASDYNKPNGQTIIRPEQALAFLEKLPIEKFHGIGKVTAQKMRSFGITDGLTLRNQTIEFLAKHFGKAGRYYYHIVRGDDQREVKPNRIRKSVGAERTFTDNKRNINDLKLELDHVIGRLIERLEKVDREGFTLTLKLKTAQFMIINRSLTFQKPLRDPGYIKQCAYSLLEKCDLNNQLYRLIGLQISNFRDGDEKELQQYDLLL